MSQEMRLLSDGFEITRVFDAPRAEVFTWWSQAEKLAQWSGCKETTRCEVAMDFRPGGSFTQKMQIAVNGGSCEFAFTGHYEEIVVPERIRYRADLGGGTIRILAEFFDLGDRTKMVLTHSGFADPNACKFVTQGTTESLDKLAAMVSSVGTLR